MPTRKSASPSRAKKKSTAKKSSARKKTARKSAGAPSGPLVDVARKIGSTLGNVAVRTGIVKPGGEEPGPAES